MNKSFLVESEKNKLLLHRNFDLWPLNTAIILHVKLSLYLFSNNLPVF
jgi:hypothetical protein